MAVKNLNESINTIPSYLVWEFISHKLNCNAEDNYINTVIMRCSLSTYNPVSLSVTGVYNKIIEHLQEDFIVYEGLFT